MKLTMKRLFSVLLVLCMMLSVLPVGAFAEGDDEQSYLPGIPNQQHTFNHVDVRIENVNLKIVTRTINVATGATVGEPTEETIRASVTKVHSVTIQGNTYTNFKKSGNYEFRKTRGVSLPLSGFNSESTAVAVLDLKDGTNKTWENVSITFNANGIAAAAKNCDGYRGPCRLSGLDFNPAVGSASDIYSEYVHYVVPVRKDWSDSDNQDGLRPDGITVNLLKNGEVVDSAVLNAGNNWYHEFAVDGNASDANAYSVAEASAPDGYTKSDAVIKDGIFVITNTHETAKRNISVTKVWHDDGPNSRPANIEVKLLANGVEVEGKTATLNADNEWKYTWENLPVNAAGKAITYTIQEADVSGYQSAVTGDVTNGFIVTNTQTTTVSGTKTWDDGDNRDNKRPGSITINLNVRNSDGVDEMLKSKTVTAEDNWAWSFTNLPKYDTNGNLITYTITENPVSGYTSHVDGYNVKNSYSPETTSVKVTKEWDDAQNQDGVRPETVKVQLYKTVDSVKAAVGDPVELPQNGEWKYEWTDLYVNEAGKPITYSVEELDVSDYYTSNVSPYDKEKGFIITNTHTPATITISGEKTWDLSTNKTGEEVQIPESITVRLKGDGKEYEKTVTPNEGGRWLYSFENLPKYAGGKEIQYTITEDAVDEFTPTVDGFNIVNVYTPGETSVSVKKVWDDANDQDRLRPESVTVKLYAFGLKEMGTVVLNESNGWTHTFTGLNQKYMGVDIQYTVKEVNLSKDYKANVTGDMTKGYTITNTHTPATTSVSVEKVWNDENDLAGFRPESVQVQLYELTNDGPTNPVGERVTLNAAGKWEYTWTNLPAKNGGRDINYTVIELPVKNYTARYSGSMADGFTITNTHEVEKMNVTVHKTWADGNDADGLRPDEVTVQLLRNGTKVGEATLNAENQWTYTFENQPVYAGGEEADYVVVEKAVANYQAKVVYKDTDTGLAAEITNTYTPEETSITVTKKWTDNSDKLGERPDKVTIYLLADGEKTGDELVLNKENKWTGTFEDLPLNKDGKEIKYTVSEKSVKNYNAKVTGSAEKGFVVTNTHTSIPTTGDESNLPLYAVLFSVGAVALVSAVVLGRKKYGKRG